MMPEINKRSRKTPKTLLKAVETDSHHHTLGMRPFGNAELQFSGERLLWDSSERVATDFMKSACTLLSLCLPLLAVVVDAAPALQMTFEGPRTAWSPVPNRYGVKLKDHQRVRKTDQGGDTGAEYFNVVGPPGYSGLLLVPVGHAPILEDLLIELRLQCDHPGVLPAMRVVFPRVTDEGTGAPLKRIVRGDVRSQGDGRWENLAINDPVKLVRRHARALSGALGRNVDHREAYVDAVVLIVPSDLRGSQVWVDELTVHGYVKPQAVTKQASPDAGPTQTRRVSVTQRGLAIDDRMFYPRVVTCRGEPLEELRKLGFNCVAFKRLPSDSLLREATRLKLEVICPAPDSNLLSSSEIDKWDAVIAWMLPGRADGYSLDAGAAQVERIRSADQRLSRPILAMPHEAWGGWSRLADGLIVPPDRANESRLSIPAARQFTQAQRLAQPGTNLLAAVSITHSQPFMDQVANFAPAGTVTPWRGPWGVMNGALASAVAGARGVWVTSDAPLTDERSKPMRARLGLAMLNLRLALIEPWLRDGVSAGRVPGPGPRQSATIFVHGRTRLLVQSPAIDRRVDAALLRYVVPGVTESAKAYELTPVGMKPIPLTRLTGGSQVMASSPSSLILLTDDIKAAAQMSSRIKAMSRRAEALQLALAVEELQHSQSHVSPLASSHDTAALAAAKRLISHAKSAQSSGDRERSYEKSTQALLAIAEWNRERLRKAGGNGALESSPLAGQAATIIDHKRLLDLLPQLERGPNLLPGGDFESHQSAAAAGWRHVARETTGAAARVEFSEDQPAHGRRSLRIDCPASPNSDAARAVVEITSSRVSVSAGQLVEITGLVRVQTSADGGAVEITDSLGGEELSLTVDRQMNWRPFRLLRRATADGPITVSISARGPIVAGVDALMIRPIELPSPAKAAVFGAPALQRK